MIIGIAGTAKNTGKTTALAALLREAAARGIRAAVTGIGYDGEERDTITLLPKPRLELPPGTIATTSEECLRVSSAVCEILHRTGYRTPLGEVLVLRVIRAGTLVVAGPSTTAALREVCGIMAGEGQGALFVDGSLNRIAPMVVADRIVFATGAARTTDLTTLAAETAALEKIFSYHRSAREAEERTPTLETTSLLEPGDAADLLAHAHGMAVAITGLISQDALHLIASTAKEISLRSIEFSDPLKLILAGDPVRTAASLVTLAENGVRITFRVRPALVSFTVNPYYPAYSGTTYSAAFLPAVDLARTLREALTTPVTDVIADGAAGLLDRLV